MNMQFGRPAQDFLRSLGFNFSSGDGGIGAPEGYTFEQLLNRHHRIECRTKIGPVAFGPVFEEVVAQLLLSRFRFDILRKVKIEDEGTGGDYDIMAFQSPHLHYIECKTGKDKKFPEIFARHQFLAPASTIILIDESKEAVGKFVSDDVQPFLTRWAKERDQNIAKIEAYKYPVEAISPTGASYLIYHTFRNMFIASGEDLDRVIRGCLRYFHQVVQQSSYWS